MNILVLSNMGDAHLHAVRWALETLGHGVAVLDWADYPRDTCCTIRIKDDSGARFHGPGLGDKIDVIWNRRLMTPNVRPGTHLADVQVVIRESVAFRRNAVVALGDSGTRWVNAPEAARAAEDKVRQLQVAAACGFSIPETIVSNDPDAIRELFDRSGGDIIYKPFAPGGWQDGKQISLLATAALSEAHMANAESMRKCPGIYQKNIAKAYELRVIVMGTRVLAVKLLSQLAAKTLDWRYDIPFEKLPIREASLPEKVRTDCLRFMKSMGLDFGCIDLIYSQDGDYVFLEVNEAGQFLWIEHLDPSIRMLDIFCSYLTGSTASNPDISIAQFWNSEAGQAFLAAEKAIKTSNVESLLISEASPS